MGYYSPKVEARVQNVDSGANLLNLIFAIDKGSREKIEVYIDYLINDFSV